MAYTLVPEGSELQKVTPDGKKAVDAKYRHDSIQTFLGNPNTPLLIGGVSLLALLPIIFNLFRKAAEDQGLVTDELTWSKIYKASLLGPAGISTLLAGEIVGETKLSDIGGIGDIGDIKIGVGKAPAGVTIKDLWEALF